MCHQSVGLIQAALERAGVSTVSVSTCEEITSRVGPPRWLRSPFPFGFPLGRAHDPALQRQVILEALALLDAPGPPPVTAALGAAPGEAGA